MLKNNQALGTSGVNMDVSQSLSSLPDHNGNENENDFDMGEEEQRDSLENDDEDNSIAYRWTNRRSSCLIGDSWLRRSTSVKSLQQIKPPVSKQGVFHI